MMADQFRYDCLGANGNKIVRTPNLDRLAAQSANFGNAFVQAPVCVPSRVSYFTGRYPHSHKNRVNYTPCDPREVFLQRMMKDAGYQTGTVGKLHLYPPTAEHARETGWDRVLLHDGVGTTDPYSDYVKWRKANDPHAVYAVQCAGKARHTRQKSFSRGDRISVQPGALDRRRDLQNAAGIRAGPEAVFHLFFLFQAAFAVLYAGSLRFDVRRRGDSAAQADYRSKIFKSCRCLCRS